MNGVIWLLTVELLGLTALPLCAFLFRSWPDRGYGLTKPLGILLVAFVNWWLGSAVGLGNYPIALWLLAIALGLGGLVLYRIGFADLAGDQRTLLSTIAVEEVLFIAAFTWWAYVRSRNPDIYGTEKPMDFMLLQVSGLTHSFPPPDAWLSGHSVNYYYLGYAIFAMLGKMAGVDPRYGFSLANVTIFALGCSGGFALSLALTRSRLWGLAGAFAVMLAGNLDGVGQVLTQISNGGLSGNSLNLWCSTRVLDGGCNNYHVITEFPIFSVLWNDLHPHVMALPFALLAIGIAVHALLDNHEGPEPRTAWYLRLALAALVIGALFPINSWDYPTYLLLALGAFAAAAYRRDELSGRRLAEIVTIVPVSLILYLPYYLTVHNSKTVAIHLHPSALGDVLTIIGGLLIPIAIFVLWRLAASIIAQNSTPEGRTSWPLTSLSALPAGTGWWIVGGVLFVIFAVPGRVDTISLLLIAAAAYTLLCRLRDDDPATLMVLGLAIAGVTLILLSDVVYLRDNFDNSPNYRMNTVFKLYYQAWLLLAAGVPYAIAAIARSLRAWNARGLLMWSAAAVLLAVGLAMYPLEGVGSQGSSKAASPGLDGLAYLAATDPADYAAVTAIRNQLPDQTVIAEADGQELAGSATYGSCTEYWVCADVSVSRISALSGRSTVIGWPNSHEALWRGAYGTSSDAQKAYAQLTQRENDIRTLYSTSSTQAAREVIRRYHIDYIYVGPLEHTIFETVLHSAPGALGKFGSMLRIARSWPGATLYQVPAAMLAGVSSQGDGS